MCVWSQAQLRVVDKQEDILKAEELDAVLGVGEEQVEDQESILVFHAARKATLLQTVGIKPALT